MLSKRRLLSKIRLSAAATATAAAAAGDTPLGLGLVQKVMTALVSALDFLHDRGVVHR
jgi:serine/threonine protein kinase